MPLILFGNDRLPFLSLHIVVGPFHVLDTTLQRRTTFLFFTFRLECISKPEYIKFKDFLEPPHLKRNFSKCASNANLNFWLGRLNSVSAMSRVNLKTKPRI